MIGVIVWVLLCNEMEIYYLFNFVGLVVLILVWWVVCEKFLVVI